MNRGFIIFALQGLTIHSDCQAGYWLGEGREGKRGEKKLAVITETTEKQNPVNISAKPATRVPLHLLPKHD